MNLYKIILLLFVLTSYANAKVHCKTRLVGKYVTSKDYRSAMVEDTNACTEFCSEQYKKVQETEDGPRQIKCYAKSSLIETFGAPLPPRSSCITKWSGSNEVFNTTLKETKSMCDHNFRINVRYQLERNFYQEGFDVKVFWKDQQIRQEVNLPRCRGELKGLAIVNNPKFSGPRKSEQLCIDDCKAMYDRYTEQANGDPRLLNCYYANKKVEVYGSLDEKKECKIVNMANEQVEQVRHYPSASMCESNFRQNQIYRLNRKYEGQLFHMNLIYDSSVIKDYYHQARCEYKLYGQSPNALKSSSMVQSKDECNNFCQERYDRDVDRANSEARWATCHLAKEKVSSLGQEPSKKTKVQILDRETKEPLYRSWLSFTPSIAKSRYRYYKNDLIRRNNKYGEYHFDLYFGDEIIESYDRFGICKLGYILRGRMSGDKTKELKTLHDCETMCRTQDQKIRENFPQYEVSTTCRYKGERLNIE